MEKQETISVFSSFLIFSFPCLDRRYNFQPLFFFSSLSPSSIPVLFFLFFFSSKDTFPSFLLHPLYFSVVSFHQYIFHTEQHNKHSHLLSIFSLFSFTDRHTKTKRTIDFFYSFLFYYQGQVWVLRVCERVPVSGYGKYTFLFIFLSIRFDKKLVAP